MLASFFFWRARAKRVDLREKGREKGDRYRDAMCCQRRDEEGVL